MGNLTRYSGLSAKLRAMKAKLLTEEDYDRICELASVADVAAYLKKKPAYEQSFAQLSEFEVHRGEVERLLTLSIYDGFRRIYRFADAGQRKFMELYFKRYEVSLIKRAFRLAADQKSILPILYGAEDFFRKYSQLNLQALDDANSLPEAVAALEGSEYYAPLARLAEEEITLFDLEMALDMYYFGQIWKRRGTIAKGEDLEVLTEAFGAKFDMINLNWIQRSKRFKGLNAGDILAMLIPVENRLHRRELTRLAEADSREHFAQALAQTWYAKRYRELTPSSLEEMYVEVLRTTLERESRSHPYSMAVIYSYLYQKEHEVDRLTTALEGIRYGLEPSAIRQLINRQ